MTVPDVLIIGGGPGGYVAGVRAAQLGGKVVIVENDKIGGTCLNRGCIPTKILVERTKLLTKLRDIGTADTNTSRTRIDLPRIMQRKDLIVERIGKSTKRLLESYGIEIVEGSARIVGQREVEIDCRTGKQRMSAKNLIIATGSLPANLPVPGGELEGVLSGDQMLAIRDAPERLVIIGGGGIGVEFACIFNAVGTKVTIVELMPQILPNEDSDMSQYLREILENRGTKIYTNARVKEISNRGPAGLSVRFSLEGQEKVQEVDGDRILVSVGRKANTQNLGLEDAGTALERGWIKTDSKMMTNQPNIFAVGDVTGKYQLAYVAWTQGVVAAENAMGKKSDVNYSVIPKCTFSDPQLASVGLTESQAKDKGLSAKVGFFSFSDNGRALALGEENGGIKILTDSDTGEILGAHIMGPEAAELIGSIALAMRLEATIQDLEEMICIHPSLFEAIKEAALDTEGRAIHQMKK